MVTQPCKDCPGRHTGCHSSCDRYAEFCRENKEQKDAIKAIRAETVQLLNFDPKFEHTRRSKQNKKRMRKW